jgi:hypothetical protein
MALTRVRFQSGIFKKLIVPPRMAKAKEFSAGQFAGYVLSVMVEVAGFSFRPTSRKMCMPIKRAINRSGGAFTPDELALLQRVFDQVSRPGDTDEFKNGLASRIIANFQVGIKDEKELVALSKRPLGR